MKTVIFIGSVHVPQILVLRALEAGANRWTTFPLRGISKGIRQPPRISSRSRQDLNLLAAVKQYKRHERGAFKLLNYHAVISPILGHLF